MIRGAMAAAVATIAPAQASVIYLPATDEVKFVNDGQPGLYVEYGVGKIYMLWTDEDFRNLADLEDNSGLSSTWSIWLEMWGPRTKRVVLALRKWRELPPDKQALNIKPVDRQRWKKDMFATANSPRRHVPAPQENSTSSGTPFWATPSREAERLDENGCPPGKKYYERREGISFFGIKMGEGKLTWSGCLTDGEAAGSGAGSTTYSPLYVPPVPTYQPPRPIRCTTYYGVTTCF